ncbi:MAG: ABC transporter substrate-binding protein [Acidobacteria bacterium]|nr:ABC transporter substrate-binding protein [Acidobacteriota bacterium]MBK9709279.1 ABC transporter substrate-binding protein [Acidobacteriota bacterium]
MAREIKVAHSPDSDDAFMFYGLATDKIDTGELHFTHVLKDIQSLNQIAMTTREYDVTAVSFHAYAYISDNYVLLPHGASIGDGYGPLVVARENFSPGDLKDKRIAVPGTLTSAFLALKLHTDDFDYAVVPFDEIIDEVVKGNFDAGLLIHEGQLTYHEEGLKKILDLGDWWKKETGLPLPMGGNVIRRDLGPELQQEVSKWLHRSIQYSMDNRENALAYAMQFARDMPVETADKFVAMWVNKSTLGYTDRDRQAVQLMLDEGFRKGIIPREVKVEFVD